MKVAVIYNPSEIRDSDVINVFGMPTKERYSHKMVEMVASALERGGHNVRIIEGNRWVIDELQDFMPRVVMGERPGMVYNMAYGIQGQSRYTHLPAMLEMLGIPYVGSGPSGHAVALDKVLTKIVFQRHGLPTPAFWLFSGPNDDVNSVRYPVIVKPKMEAVSWGLRVAHTEIELREAVGSITREFQQQALVEEFVPGREFAVGLLGNGEALETLPIVEIDLGGDPDAIQSLDDKLQRPRKKICPAEVSSELAEELRGLARGAFNALGLFDFARVDFRMDPENRLHMLEVNSMASLNITGSFVHAAQVAGLDFTALINRMLDIAAIRYFGDAYARMPTETDRKVKRAQLPARVRSYLRAHVNGIVKSIEEMVAMNSHTLNVEGVNTLGDWVSSRFEGLGFRRHVHPQTEVGDILYFTNHDGDGNDVLLLGHVDTIYDYQNHVPFHVDRGRLIGSGVAESKGGIAVILSALQALRSARALKRIRCGILLTSDEMTGGRFSGELVAEKARRSGRVVGTKYGDLNGGIVTSCLGMRQYQIELTSNKSARARALPDVVSALSRKALALRKLGAPGDGATVVIRQMSARTNPGMMADHGAATVEIRFMSEEQGKKLDEMIRRIAEKDSDRWLQARVRSGLHRPAVTGVKASLEFYESVKRLAEKLEVRVQAVHRDRPAGICDVPDGVPVLGGFGPLGGEMRSQNEYIVRDSLIDRSVLLAMVMYESA